MRARLVTSLVFATILVYAIVRYVVVGTVAPAQIPVFIVNKALAVASLALVAFALVIGPLVRMRLLAASWMTERKQFGITGFGMGALHAVLTIATLSPGTYAKLYTGGHLTFWGGLAVLAGALTFGALILPAITSATIVRKAMTADAWRRVQKLGVLALAIGLAHVAALGWRSWITPETWPGGLPPLTMVAFAPGVLAFAVRAIAVARESRVPFVGQHIAPTSQP